MKYYFILNPHSQTGKGRLIWKNQLLPCLKASHSHWKVFYTRYEGHCTQIVRQLTRSPSRPLTIVILGGDGTLNEAINGIEQFNNVTLGYIPTGSSNDFARGMKLTSDPLQTLHNILRQEHQVWLDYGEVQAPGKAPKRFIVSSGIGFDAYVTDEALTSPIKNVLNTVHLGKLTYALIALKKLITISLQPVRITVDDTYTLKFPRFYFASSHNLPFEGGGFKFSPNARPDDGKLEVCVIHGFFKFLIPILLPTAFFGLHKYFPGVTLFSCEKMTIRLAHPFPVHTDGETYHPQTRIKVWCNKGKIHFVY
ncbi:MAG TPA: diacylglycerol kinase family lipid kinase [Candidatus Scybalocola faecavium]|nr:diacylglycerol kinase family lipid kinase [Candidatus Scybalocola faecavium]